MTSPYATPRYPAAPNTTPSSSGLSRKVPRAPLINPYDQFTKSDFDAFINDITGKLRHALGREEYDASIRGSVSQQHLNGDTIEGHDEDEFPEDSFAEVKARRLAKGKQRAVEHEEEEGEVPVNGIVSDDDGSEDKELQDEEAEDEEDGDSIFDDQWGQPGGGVEYGEEEEEEREQEVEEADSAAGSPHPDEVIELSSDEEEAHNVAEQDEIEQAAYYDPQLHADYDEEDDELLDGEEEQVDEDPESFPPSTRAVRPADISDPWAGVHTYAEDFYSGGDVVSPHKANAHVLPAEAEDEIEVIDIDGESEEEASHSIEVVDPWSGPRTYMEDFYSGGDVRNTDRGVGLVPTSPIAEYENGDAIRERRDRLEGSVADDTITAEQDFVTDDKDEETDEDESEDLTGNGHIDHEHFQNGRMSRIDFHTDSFRDRSESPAYMVSHERGVSPRRPSLSEHVDWNWPPAFSSGRLATAPGHLMTPEHSGVSRMNEIINVDDDDDPSSDSYTTRGGNIQDEILHYQPEPSQDRASLDAQDCGEDVANTQLFTNLNSIYADDESAYTDTVEVDELEEEAYEPVNDDDIDFGDLPDVTPAHSDISAAMEDGGISSVILEEQSKTDTIQSSVTPTFEISVEQSSDMPEPATIRLETEKTQRDEQIYLVEEPVIEGRQTEEPEAQFFDRASSIDTIDALRSVEFTQIDREYVIEEAATEDNTTPDPKEIDAGNDLDQVVVRDVDDAPLDTTETVKMIPSSPMSVSGTSAPYPMPVSADPSVPDPASASHTPLSPPTPLAAKSTLPISPISPRVPNQALYPAVEAALNLMPNITRSPLRKSTRGLFTPLTDGSPSPASPVVSDDASSKTSQVESSLLEEEMTTLQPEDSELSTSVETEVVRPDLDDIEVSSPAANLMTSQDDVPAETEVQTAPEDATTDAATAVESLVHDEPAEAQTLPITETLSHEDVSGNIDPEDLNGTLDCPNESEVNLSGLHEDLEAEVHESDKPIDAETTDQVDADDASGQAGDDALAESSSDTTVVQSQSLLAEANEDDDIDKQRQVQDDDIEPSVVSKTPISESVVMAPVREDDVFTSSATAEEGRPPKRKRSSPVVSTARVTRSMAVKNDGSVRPPSSTESTATTRARKGKGKERADDQQSEDENNSEIASVSSGASIASKLLQLPSQSTSRASSLSYDRGNTPKSRQPSPSLQGSFDFTSGRDLPPPSLIHAHGVMHHHHSRLVPMLPAQAPQPEVRRQASPSLPSPTESVHQSNAGRNSPAPSTASTNLTSSPVTRSNCRFHKISLPFKRGSRIYFVVPGCSLSNRELMEKEHIEDHGNATIKDQTNLIADVEALNLNSSSIGVLRQLVGVDLLREQEVFFLPQPGQKSLYQSQRKSKVGKPRAPNRESISMRGLRSIGSSGPSEAPQVTSRRSVTSRGDSASVSSALGHLSERGSLTTTASISSSDLSDLEDEDEEPVTKKARSDHTDAVVPELEPEPEPSASSQQASTISGHRLKPRRSRRLGKDASAYKPGPDQSDDDTEAEEAAKATKRRKGKRGLKRSRQEEGQDGDQNGGRKRRRIRSSNVGGIKKTPSDPQNTR